MPKTRRQTQAGFTLMMAIFMVASMIILAAAAAPVILTQGRREMEAEMVWRGEQYERAIGLYYRKFGKYPTSVDDLVKQTNGVRCLRQAYKDPMNKEDGSWRFIYVGPNGQLIGSLRRTSLLQTTLSGAGTSGLSLLAGGLQPPAAPGSGTSGQPSGASAPNPLEAQPQPLTGDVIGGNIIGVASKIKQPSFRLYQGGDTYEKWEFIWSPVGLIPQNPANTNFPGAPGVPNPGAAQPPTGPPTTSPTGPTM